MFTRTCAAVTVLIMFLASPSLTLARSMVQYMCMPHNPIKEFCVRNLIAIFFLALVTEIFWFYKRNRQIKTTHLQCLKPLIGLPIIDLLLAAGPCGNFSAILVYWLPAIYLTIEFLRSNATDARTVLITRSIFAFCAALLASPLIYDAYFAPIIF